VRIVVIADSVGRNDISVRNVIPPFEDALASHPGATLVEGFSRRRPNGRARVPAWLAAIRTVRKADWVFWTQLHLRPALGVWALGYTRPLARRAMLAVEQWEHDIDNLARIVDAQRMSACFVIYRMSAVELERRYPELPFHRLPMGFNNRVFRDLGLERDIYAFWMGRRHEPLHEALRAHCDARGLVYRYSMSRNDPETVTELNEVMSRSRYFVVTPPDVDNPARTGRFSPFTTRYLEGPAAGSRLLGVIPGDRAEYDELLPAAAMVEVAPDGSDLEEVLARADADPDAERRRIEVRDLVCREHGWDRRAATVYHRLSEVDEAQG
jgi:hypothetical protein